MADINYTASTPKKQYTRRIGDNGFLGADYSTAPIFASDRRFRELKNVWKDYKSGSGVAIETVPGYRKLHYPPMTQEDIEYFTFLNNDLPSSIHTLGFIVIESPVEALARYNTEHQGEAGFEPVPTTGTFVMIHSGVELSCIPVSYISKLSTENIPDVFRARSSYDRTQVVIRDFHSYSFDASFQVLPNRKTVTIQAKDSALILGGDGIYKLYLASAEDLNDTDDVFSFHCDRYIPEIDVNNESISAYTPTTYLNGEPYEQKNMISLRSKEIYHKTIAELTSGTYGVEIVLHEKVKKGNSPYKDNIVSLTVDGTSKLTDATATVSGDYVSSLAITGYLSGDVGTKVTVEIEYASDPAKFTSYRDFEDYKDRTTFNEGNPDYSGTAFDAIAGCTICTSFDERIFLAGNPKLPNTIFYSQRDLTGYNNATYFGVLNYNNLGTSNAPITAMIPSASTLCVLKDDSATDPTLYFLTGFSTEKDLIPRIYTVERGLPGIGCKGAACNFLDDIVFMSRNGVIGIDKQAVNLERTLGDRSTLINGKLLLEDVTQAVFAEAEGYLWCLFKNNGHVYLADSRAYTQGAGYEWYFIDSVGSWSNDADAYEYCDEYVNKNASENDTADLEDRDGTTGVAETEDGEPIRDSFNNGVHYTVVKSNRSGEQYVGDVYTIYTEYTETREADDDGRGHITYNVTLHKDTSGSFITLVETEQGSGEYYQVVKTGEKVCTNSTVFHPATCMVAANDRIFFGTDNGDLLTFNNDKRGERAVSEDETEPNRYPFMLRPEWYTFCGHRIESFVETSDDDGGIGNLTKDTVRRSCVVDMKAMLGSKYRITTYTDRDGWKNDNAATGSMNDASQTMLDAVNFSGDEHINVQIRERARKWVHKRYRIESNGFRSPFGVYRITYNFEINGRIK